MNQNIYEFIKKNTESRNKTVIISKNKEREERCRMKKLMAITGSILLLCVIITSVYAPHGTAVPPEKTEISEMSKEAVKEKYRLSVYERKVAAFENGKDYPIYISDVYVNSLPETDRRLLEKGIYVSDRKSLNRLIEDYCS